MNDWAPALIVAVRDVRSLDGPTGFCGIGEFGHEGMSWAGRDDVKARTDRCELLSETFNGKGGRLAMVSIRETPLGGIIIDARGGLLGPPLVNYCSLNVEARHGNTSCCKCCQSVRRKVG